MKKILPIMLSALLLFSLMSCGSSDPFKGTWVGIDDDTNSKVTITFDGSGNITSFNDSSITSSGTYKDNGDGTITITLDLWTEPVTFVYDANALNENVLKLHDVKQAVPGYELELQE